MGYWDRILKYARGGPEAIDGWPEPLPIAEFKGAVAQTLGAALAVHGFEQVAPRRWVRSTRAPIRDLIELQALKGMSYCPMWGVSLDFVPHLTARGDVRWHRSAKSARFDLVYRPIDFTPNAAASRDWSASPFATRAELNEDLARVTRLVLAQALPFWDDISGGEDLPRVYRAHRRRTAVGLPFESFPQQCLAAAFVFARHGDAAAQPAFEDYLLAIEASPETRKRLEQLLLEANSFRDE
jgi:hypothetical protein